MGRLVGLPGVKEKQEMDQMGKEDKKAKSGAEASKKKKAAANKEEAKK